LLFCDTAGLQGLPFANLTTLSVAADGALWLGSDAAAAAMRRDANGEWRVFRGGRWLPGASRSSESGCARRCRILRL
jgi:hypothetical protein